MRKQPRFPGHTHFSVKVTQCVPVLIANLHSSWMSLSWSWRTLCFIVHSSFSFCCLLVTWSNFTWRSAFWRGGEGGMKGGKERWGGGIKGGRERWRGRDEGRNEGRSEGREGREGREGEQGRDEGREGEGGRAREGWRERGGGREEGKEREGREGEIEGRWEWERSVWPVPSSACPARTSSGLVGRPLSPSPDLPRCSPTLPWGCQSGGEEWGECSVLALITLGACSFISIPLSVVCVYLSFQYNSSVCSSLSWSILYLVLIIKSYTSCIKAKWSSLIGLLKSAHNWYISGCSVFTAAKVKGQT